MKKLKLKVLETATSRLLTREQLKSVIGGSYGYCNGDYNCPTGYHCVSNTCINSGPGCGTCPDGWRCLSYSGQCVI